MPVLKRRRDNKPSIFGLLVSSTENWKTRLENRAVSWKLCCHQWHVFAIWSIPDGLWGEWLSTRIDFCVDAAFRPSMGWAQDKKLVPMTCNYVIFQVGLSNARKSSCLIPQHPICILREDLLVFRVRSIKIGFTTPCEWLHSLRE